MVDKLSNVRQASNIGDIKAPNASGISPKVDLTQLSDEVVLSAKSGVKKDAPLSKKIGVGLASGIYPGFGQLINGQVGKGAKYFFGQFALDTLTQLGVIALTTVNPGLALAAGGAGILAHIGVSVASIIDAVKNA